MPKAPLAPSALPADWREVIATVESAVEQSLAALQQREQTWEAEIRKLDVGGAQWASLLEQLRDKFQGLEALAEKARVVVQEGDTDLAEGEAALQKGVERAQQLNRTLAELCVPD